MKARFFFQRIKNSFSVNFMISCKVSFVSKLKLFFIKSKPWPHTPLLCERSVIYFVRSRTIVILHVLSRVAFHRSTTCGSPSLLWQCCQPAHRILALVDLGCKLELADVGRRWMELFLLVILFSSFVRKSGPSGCRWMAPRNAPFVSI